MKPIILSLILVAACGGRVDQPITSAEDVAVPDGGGIEAGSCTQYGHACTSDDQCCFASSGVRCLQESIELAAACLIPIR